MEMSLFWKNKKEYNYLIEKNSIQYKQSRLKAASNANCEAIKFLWFIGKEMEETLSRTSKNNVDFTNDVTSDLKCIFQKERWLTEATFKYARLLYLLYKDLNKSNLDSKKEIEDSPIWHIPWGHHILIIKKLYNNPSKALFYVRQTIKHGWGRKDLSMFLQTDLYERMGNNSFEDSKNDAYTPKGILAQELVKDPFLFNFLEYTEKFHAYELKETIKKNVIHFLLERNTGFAFIGKDYRIVIGQTESFIDILFYNLILRCYIVVKVETVSEIGQIVQLGTHVTAINHSLKKDFENPTIGLLICKSKEDILIRYELESTCQPIGISEAELSKVYPVDFKSTLPSVEDLEKELGI